MGGAVKTVLGWVAPVFGSVFGGPAGAIIGGGIGGLLRGGGFKGAALSALTSGIGGWAGQSLGNTLASHLPAVSMPIIGGGLKSFAVNAMTGLGGYMGSEVGRAFSTPLPPIPNTVSTLQNGAPVNIPSFEELQQESIKKTEQVFDREGMFKILDQSGRRDPYSRPYRRIGRETDIPLRDRDRFPSLKLFARKQRDDRIVQLHNQGRGIYG